MDLIIKTIGLIKRLAKKTARDIVELIFPKSDAERLLEVLGPEKVADMIPQADISPERDLVPAARDAHAVWPYRHPLAESIIHLVKSSGSRAAAECAGIAAWRYIKERILSEMDKKHDATNLTIILVPIPLSPRRRRERGYNQSEWIAEAIVRYGILKTKIEVRSDILRRTSHAGRQALKNRDERRASVEQNIFEAKLKKDDSFTAATYIIIDDVITTGSTLAAARRALVIAGAKKIICLAVGH